MLVINKGTSEGQIQMLIDWIDSNIQRNQYTDVLAGTDKVINSNDQTRILGNNRALRPANDHEFFLNNLDCHFPITQSTCTGCTLLWHLLLCLFYDVEILQARLKFHNTGPMSIPGVIIFSISDGDEGKPGLSQLDSK